MKNNTVLFSSVWERHPLIATTKKSKTLMHKNTLTIFSSENKILLKEVER